MPTEEQPHTAMSLRMYCLREKTDGAVDREDLLRGIRENEILANEYGYGNEAGIPGSSVILLGAGR